MFGRCAVAVQSERTCVWVSRRCAHSHSITCHQNDEPCAATLLVETGNGDLIDFVKHIQEQVPRDMWVSVVPKKSYADLNRSLDTVANPLSEQSFVGETHFVA